MSVNESVVEPIELTELKAQLAQAMLTSNRWKQLYKDSEGELEAKTNQLLECSSECERYQQLYAETLELLKREQADHAKTKDNLLKILGDTIAKGVAG